MKSYPIPDVLGSDDRVNSDKKRPHHAAPTILLTAVRAIPSTGVGGTLIFDRSAEAPAFVALR